jgi:hypothetical protein
VSDFDFEPMRGLPACLPRGEMLLWQGNPEWRALAWRAFHIKHVAIYFAVLAIWTVASAWADGVGIGGALLAAAWVPLMAVAAVALLAALAWLSARTTVYTITSKRLVLRIGIALPITINVPFGAIESVGLRLHGEGLGDIPSSLSKGYRLAFLVLWPHARPWHVRGPQPMLRCVADAERVARILVEAMSTVPSAPVRPATEDIRAPDRRPAAPTSIPAAAA